MPKSPFLQFLNKHRACGEAKLWLRKEKITTLHRAYHACHSFNWLQWYEDNTSWETERRDEYRRRMRTFWKTLLDDKTYKRLKRAYNGQTCASEGERLWREIEKRRCEVYRKLFPKTIPLPRARKKTRRKGPPE